MHTYWENHHQTCQIASLPWVSSPFCQLPRSCDIQSGSLSLSCRCAFSSRSFHKEDCITECSYVASVIMAASPLSKTFIASCLCLNIAFSIVIVILNKWIYTIYGFPNITMTCIHFIFTTVGLLICQQFNLFQPKSLPVLKMLPLSLTFCGFVVFTNLSLQTNTVGTYQLAKTMTTPCIIFIQGTFYHRPFSTQVKLTLVCWQLMMMRGHV